MKRDRRRRLPWPAVVVFAFLGACLAAQFNLQRRLESTPRVDEARAEQVLRLYNAQTAENEKLREKIAALRADVERGRSQQDVGQQLERVRSELDQTRRVAGLVPLQGPGIRVLLNDAKFPSEPDFDQSAYTVHDQDLLLVVNELWAARAEAIAINKQRAVATTEVRCSGPVIDVNQRAIAPPYEILAVGDAETLRAALEDLRGGIVDQLRNAGIDVKVIKEKNLVVPALAEAPTFRYARPGRAPDAAPAEGE